MTRKLTTEEFISKAKNKHGGRYDYSKVNYKNNKTKVEVICRLHGSFWQKPNDHLNGRGCLSCSGVKKLTIEEFIEKAKNKHGGRYDYSKVKYKNNKTKVEITCKKHGSFWQTPNSHLQENGCPVCSGNKESNTEEFIEKAKNKHGETYVYSKVKYKNNKTKVEVICRLHGSFWQTPISHLKSSGCPVCVANKKKSNTDKFIISSKGVHRNKYDYSKVDYRNSSTKVEIICSDHGSFWQTPNSHLQGSGCPACGANKRKSNTEEFIEKARKKHGDRYDYSKVNYKNNKTKVEIVCSTHGSFMQTPSDHLNGSNCPVCVGKVTQTATIFRKLAVISEIEPFTYQFIHEFTGLAYPTVVYLCREHGVKVYKKVLIKETSLFNSIENILSKLGIKFEIIRNARVLKPNKNLNKFKIAVEIDIYIPDLKLGFEFNGMWYHKEGENGMKHRGYHMEKYNTAKSQGITLYHIWEDEYSCEEDIEMWNTEIEEIINAKKTYYRRVYI